MIMRCGKITRPKLEMMRARTLRKGSKVYSISRLEKKIALFLGICTRFGYFLL
jgi:hypothetical protein